MRTPVLSVAASALTLAFVSLPGCELFGVVPCSEDGDCPESLPFCVDDVCSAEEDTGRTGRGIDDEEGCTDDAACGKGLCYDLADTAAHFDAALVGTCVPGPDDDASCAEAVSLGGPDRVEGAPAIFSATAQRAGGDCTPGTENLTISVLYLDREGDQDFTGGATTLFVMQPGGISPDFVQGSISGDGTSGEGFFFVSSCVPISVEYVGIRMGDSSPTSNALCVPVTGTP